MSLVRDIGLRAKSLASPAAIAVVLVYFAYHAVEGDRGVYAWLAVSQELTEARAEAANLAAERRVLEHRVSLLGDRSLNLDMLDERARLMLNVGRHDEVVIFDDARKN